MQVGCSSSCCIDRVVVLLSGRMGKQSCLSPPEGLGSSGTFFCFLETDKKYVPVRKHHRLSNLDELVLLIVVVLVTKGQEAPIYGRVVFSV